MSKIADKHIDAILDVSKTIRLISMVLVDRALEREELGNISWLLGSLEERPAGLVTQFEESRLCA